jgi:hypothetical protein
MTAAVTPGMEEMLALAKAVGRVAPEHSSDRHVLLEAERALRLAAKAADEDFPMSPALLVDAWKRYVNLFGEPPHGTEKQMRALLRLIPPSRCPALSTTGEPKR